MNGLRLETLKDVVYDIYVLFMSFCYLIYQALQLRYRPLQQHDLYRQSGKTFLVTGGMGGIGFEIVKELLILDGFVIITDQFPENRAEFSPMFMKLEEISSNFKYYQVSLECMDHIVAFCQLISCAYRQLDGLVCNAATLESPHGLLTENGFHPQIAVNYLSNVVMLDGLMKPLRKAQGRVVFVSSYAHRLNFPDIGDGMTRRSCSKYQAYVQSKACQVAFVRHMAGVLSEDGISIFSVHPGFSNTDLYKTNFLTKFAVKLCMITAQQSADIVLFVLLSPTLADCSGEYLEYYDIVKPSVKVQDEEFVQYVFDKTNRLLEPWLVD